MSTLPIPQAALTQHVIALGKTGSGKSSKLRVLVEHQLERDQPVAIVDRKGDWWGLKSSDDGKRSGFPIVIFGGEHADVPINAHSGAHVAELVATGNRSALIDLGGWMVGETTRFWLDFAATYFKLARGARTLVLPEVHNFAPQGKVLDPDAGKALHWANRLASEGRAKGITILADSQRPQKVHKDFLTSCETLIACRVIHKLDRDAIRDWIDGCADRDAGRQVLETLAQMKRTDAWCWSPEVEFGPRLITWPMFKTYDSFKPQPADTGKLKGWAEVDLDDVKTKLARVVEEAKANDPKALKARIAELERELKKPPAVENREVEAAEARGYQRGLEESTRAFYGYRGIVEAAVESASKALAETLRKTTCAAFNEVAEKMAGAKIAVHVAPITQPATRKAIVDVVNHVARKQPPAAKSGEGGALPRCERALLTVLAQYHQGRTRVQLALLTGYSSNSSSFANALGALRSAGYVDRGDPVRITAAGLKAAGDYEPLPTGDALRRHWLERLDKAERALLQVVLDKYPAAIERDDLASESGYSATSSSFANALGRLRSLELVERGEIRAAQVLFT